MANVVEIRKMKYKVVLTHNPQDYFEGAEPDDLISEISFKRSESGAFDTILAMIDGGYTAIITPDEDDVYG